MSRILLDTSAYSAFMIGIETVKVRVQEAEEILLNPVVLGELLSGFRKGSHRLKNEKELDTFITSPRVGMLDMDEQTAHRYAVIHESLRRAGTPIPTNDLWIAATAMQHGLVVITADDHFRKVPQIVTEILRSRS